MQDLLEPLSDDEQRRLDAYLVEFGTESSLPSLAALDGFLTAIVSGYSVVPPSEWLPLIWGGDEFSQPQWDSAAQFEEFVLLTVRHMNSICSLLESTPDEWMPLFELGEEDEDGREVWVDTWCTGYVVATSLRSVEWGDLPEEIAPYFASIVMLGLGPAVEGFDDLDEETIEAMVDDVPDAALALFDYFEALRLSGNEPVAESGDLDRIMGVAANEAEYFIPVQPKELTLCPCGSGKPYVRCCGLN